MVARSIINHAGPLGLINPVRPLSTKGETTVTNPFVGLFRKALQSTDQGELHVTAHAEKRLSERGISLDGEAGKRLNQAIDELKAKGARDSLILTQDGAFLVNIQSRTLITAMDPSEMHDRIITQIDSVSLKNL
ncbi:MAG: flagellar biosynthesis protein [Candidatus Ozemobacteraceae bacterium]